MAERVASAVWRIRPEVVLALDAQLGLPVDSYVNGSQTWLVDEGERTFEWRLHPVASYRAPDDLSHYDLWEQVVGQLSTDAAGDSLRLGEETRTLDSLWDGLECSVAFGDDVEPANLAHLTTEALGIAPDLCGLVDHQVVGDRWEHARGAVSIVELLADQLGPR